jgi:uncharacterized protein YbcC (UPF0753/DUF2309 family)
MKTKTIPFKEEKVIEHIVHHLPSQLTLKDFVHHNSLHNFQDREFFDGIFTASKIFGINVTFNINEYRKLHKQGRIREDIIDQVIKERKGAFKVEEFKQKMLNTSYSQTYNPCIGRLRRNWKTYYKIDLNNLVQPLLFRIIGGYLDQGIAIWHFPFEDKGLINALKTLEENASTSFFKTKKARTLLLFDDLSIEKLLKLLVGNPSYFENYLFDQQFAHKGWSGIVAAIEGTPETLFYKKKVHLKDFILLELLLEYDALEKVLGNNWKPLATNLNPNAENYFAKIEFGEFENILQLWQEAFEWDYYDEVLSGVGTLAKINKIKERKEQSFQSLFCVDDRECSLRRHLEYVDPKCETLGAPGFYGAAIYFQPYKAQFYDKNCPVALTPKHLIKEIEITKEKKHEIIHSKNSHMFFKGFLYSLSLGLWSAFRLFHDLFNPKMQPDIADAFAHMDVKGKLLIENTGLDQRENDLQIGYTIDEMVIIVESLLKGIGLVDNFASIIYIVAHGSSSANNPHHGAHDCGACSGRPGAVNARVFAFMANHAKVREILKIKGIVIPAETQFIPAMHDTASDEVWFYDEEILIPENARQHNLYKETFEEALDINAKERARRFASIDIKKDMKHIRKEIKKRSVSYFEPRPELGHGSNALCHVGSRDKIKGLFLDRRAFLQSYDYRSDPNGDILLQVLSPLPGVCGGINLEYYFSRMDIEKMGAGTKLPHNVTGLIGVTNSSDGDLRPGLPLQMVENHDPVRLLMMVEHKPEIVLKTIKSSQEMYDWFDKGWLHLVAISPEDGNLYHFKNGEFVLYTPLTQVSETDNILNVIETAKEMVTNQILDATKENIPTQIYSYKK